MPEQTQSSPFGASSATAGNDSLIRLSGIKKIFYTDEVETHALQDIHLEIGRGEYVAIAEPSGCGKTTLLSILGLLDTPTEGEYWLAGEPRPPPGTASGRPGRSADTCGIPLLTCLGFRLSPCTTTTEVLQLELFERRQSTERGRFAQAHVLHRLLHRRLH